MNIEEIKNRAYHGTIVLKKELTDGNGNIVRYAGERGVITAFLPDEDIYAVMFDGKIGINNFFRFDKVSFEKFCKVDSNLN